jgi:hypothetical protein
LIELSARRNAVMNLLTMRETPHANQESSTAYEVDVGALRFRVWYRSPTFLCLLAGQDPSTLFEFREGATLTMSYHQVGSTLPAEHLKASVRKIKRGQGGKLKGQYLVDLEIVKS